MSRRFVSFMSIAILGGVAAFGVSPAEAQSTQPLKSSPADPMVRPIAGSLPPLANSVEWVDQGLRNTDGGCDFTPPALSIPPGQKAVEVRQVGIDLTACTTIWEKGTPTISENLSPAQYSSINQISTPVAGSSVAPVNATLLATTLSGSGYTRAWQTDIATWTVNSVQSNISFSWDGSCVQSNSGSVNYYWKSSTGWEPPYNNSSTITQSCTEATVTSQADYKNTGFCWPNTVYSNYRGIVVTGRYNGSLVGSAATVSHSGNAGCAPLYDHWELVRVTG
jgi:hypothetical protein